ncbi:MAG: DsbA family protein [Nocardioidaceae bacterium]
MSERRKSPVIPLAVAAVAGVLLLASLIGAVTAGGNESAPAGESATTGTNQQGKAPDGTWAKLVRREPDDPLALGKVDAPVVMLAYSDFQCPFCGKFARDTEPTLVDKYVDDGTLRIEWRDFPYLGPESETAAEAGRAAADQGKFWEFHDAMYAHQLPPNSGKLDDDYLVHVAEQLGLNVDKFRADMAAKSTKQGIAKDFAEGQAIGVTGTPAFVINGVPVIGAQPTEVFERTIEKAAEEAGG